MTNELSINQNQQLDSLTVLLTKAKTNIDKLKLSQQGYLKDNIGLFDNEKKEILFYGNHIGIHDHESQNNNLFLELKDNKLVKTTSNGDVQPINDSDIQLMQKAVKHLSQYGLVDEDYKIAQSTMPQMPKSRDEDRKWKATTQYQKTALTESISGLMDLKDQMTIIDNTNGHYSYSSPDSAYKAIIKNNQLTLYSGSNQIKQSNTEEYLLATTIIKSELEHNKNNKKDESNLGRAIKNSLSDMAIKILSPLTKLAKSRNLDNYEVDGIEEGDKYKFDATKNQILKTSSDNKISRVSDPDELKLATALMVSKIESNSYSPRPQMEPNVSNLVGIFEGRGQNK